MWDVTFLLGHRAGMWDVTFPWLWKAGRLTSASRRTIFETFVKVEFIEEPPPWKYGRDLRIRGTFSFPFRASIFYRSSIAIGEEVEWPRDEESQVVLEPTVTTYDFGSIGGGRYPGSPVARAILELREIDYYHGKTELWRIKREFGPLQLRAAE